jgi:hypothetical protein
MSATLQTTGIRLELLLILSALLTGLTGAFSGDRLPGRPQLQTTGVEAAASVAVDELAEAAVAALRPIANLPRLSDRQAEPLWPVQSAFVPAVIGSSERRLE